MVPSQAVDPQFGVLTVFFVGGVAVALFFFLRIVEMFFDGLNIRLILQRGRTRCRNLTNSLKETIIERLRLRRSCEGQGEQ
jgi:hypothetical protein